MFFVSFPSSFSLGPIALPLTPLLPLKRKTLDTITVFHKASSPASVRVANLLKQLSANSTAGADASAVPRREPFELNVSEDPPTEDQLRTILGYVGPKAVGQVVKDADTEKEALRLFKETRSSFIRPMVSGWLAVGGLLVFLS